MTIYAIAASKTADPFEPVALDVLMQDEIWCNIAGDRTPLRDLSGQLRINLTRYLFENADRFYRQARIQLPNTTEVNSFEWMNSTPLIVALQGLIREDDNDREKVS